MLETECGAPPAVPESVQVVTLHVFHVMPWHDCHSVTDIAIRMTRVHFVSRSHALYKMCRVNCPAPTRVKAVSPRLTVLSSPRNCPPGFLSLLTRHLWMPRACLLSFHSKCVQRTATLLLSEHLLNPLRLCFQPALRLGSNKLPGKFSIPFMSTAWCQAHSRCSAHLDCFRNE